MTRFCPSIFLILATWAAGQSAFGQGVPLVVVSRQPDQNAKGVCVDMPLSITFNRPPVLGTAGKIRIYDAADDKLVDTLDVGVPVNNQSYTIQSVSFRAYPVLINGNTATIQPHHNLLTYGKTYYVQIDSGVLTDGTTPFSGYADKTSWVFSTKPAAPAAGIVKLTIAADGTGDFATLQGALDFVPAKNDRPVTLWMRKGTYREIVSLVNKSNLIILGEDREQTILTYANNERLQLGANSSSKRGVINAANATDIVLANLTIRNATPKGSGGWQAETVIFKNNSRAILTDVSLYSYQDTLQMSAPGYVANSYIEGDVDFMWGTGPCFFQNCTLKNLTNSASYVVSRNTAQGHGFVYVNCKFGVKEGVTGNYLAQNQGYVNSEVVLLNCALAPSLNPLAWRVQGQVGPGHYWEYNSTNTTDGKPADVSGRLAGSRRLTTEADADTIANYSDPGYVLGWKPALAPIMTQQPGKQNVSAGQEISFTASVVAVPAATYQWSKNGTPIPGATSAGFKILKAAVSDAGTYTCTAKNSSGTVTSNPAELTIK